MNISGPPESPAGSPTGIRLDDFRRTAERGEDVLLEVDGESFKLVATGQSPSGHGIAWVQGSADTTRAFVEALESAFGGKLSQAIADELGLRPTPGAALPSSMITQAIAMAETARGALDGVEFARQIERPGPVGKPDET